MKSKSVLDDSLSRPEVVMITAGSPFRMLVFLPIKLYPTLTDLLEHFVISCDAICGSRFHFVQVTGNKEPNSGFYSAELTCESL
jgi:hypothetical protein